MDLKERFDALLAIGIRREFTDEECNALGALARESESVPAVQLTEQPGCDHPLVNFWCGLVRQHTAVTNRNVVKAHKHISESIVKVAFREELHKINKSQPSTP